MVTADQLRGYRDRFRLSFRIAAFPGASSKLSPDLKRRLTAIGFLAVSVLGGFLAHGISRENALRDWENTYSPSSAVVTQAVRVSGLHEVTEIPLLHKTLRELPATLDLAGSIWIDPTSTWVVVFRDSSRAIPAEVYRWEHAPRSPPREWEPLGRGWLAFDRLLAKLDDTASKRLKPRAIPRALPGDPREIRY